MMPREERNEGHKIQDDINDAKLKELVAELDTLGHLLILHAKNTGARLNICSTMLTSKVLAATEFCDFYAYVMMLPPPNLQRKCNGHAKLCDVRHRLSCSKLGLVITPHNEVRDKLLYLARPEFPSA